LYAFCFYSALFWVHGLEIGPRQAGRSVKHGFAGQTMEPRWIQGKVGRCGAGAVS